MASIVAALGFAVLGVVLVAVGGYKYRDSKRRRERAEPVEATIVESGVTETDDASYEANVRFRFEYDGRQREATGVKPAADWGAYDYRSEAQKVVDRYQEGETATAHVDPGDLERSYLEADRTVEYASAAAAAVGVVFGLAGIGLALA